MGWATLQEQFFFQIRVMSSTQELVTNCCETARGHSQHKKSTIKGRVRGGLAVRGAAYVDEYVEITRRQHW